MKKLLAILISFLPLIVDAQDFKTIQQKGLIKVGFQESGRETVNDMLASEFAKFLNLKIKKSKVDWNQLFSNDGQIPEDYRTNPAVQYTPDALKTNDIICGTMYELDWRKKFFDYAGIVQISDLLIVRRNIKKGINGFEDLKGLTIAFLDNSTYETEINIINEEIGGGIKLLPVKSEKEALKVLTQSKADGLIAVSYLALSYLKRFRNLKLAFPVAEPQSVGWILKKGNDELSEEVRNFFETIKGDGTLDRIFREKYGISYSTYLEIINSYAQSQKNGSTRDLDAIQKSGKIVIALRDREMVYHRYGRKQFNHYLAEEFAKYLGVQLELVITKEFSDYWESDNGTIIEDSAYMPKWFQNFDVACDLIAPLPWRLKKVDVIDFMPNAKVVIGRKDTRINSVDDLRRLKGVTSKGSSYEHTLKENNIKNYIYSQGNDFFSNVETGKADYTISNIAVFNLGEYPDLEAKFILGEISLMGWAIKKNQPALRQKILEFFEYAQKEGVLDTYFKEQTGMTMKAAKNYLNALEETYQYGYFSFMFYGADKNMPREEILTLFQDQSGYIWFGTYSGAVRYNGRNMKVFDVKNGMPGSMVFDIKQDKNGEIYFATENGIAQTDNNAHKYKTLFKGVSFKGIFIDKNDKKYFYGNEGIYTIGKKNKEIRLNDELTDLPLEIHSMSQDPKKNNIIITSSNGLFKLDKKASTCKKINDGNYYYALFSSDGSLWMSSEYGLQYAKNKYFKEPQKYELLNNALNISKRNKINKITEYDDGTVWLISDYKVFQVLTLKQKPIIFDKNIGLKNYKILSFLMDKEKNFWFGMSGGVQKLSDKTLRTLYPELLNSPVQAIFEDAQNRTWFSTYTGAYYLQNGLHNFTKELNIFPQSLVLAKGEDGKLYLVNNDKLFVINDETLQIDKTVKFDNNIIHPHGIFINSNSEIFILTGKEGVIYYMKDINSEPIIIENKHTNSVIQLKEYNGKILGAGKNGLVVFENGKFTSYVDTKKPVTSFSIATVKNNATQTEDTLLYIALTDELLTYSSEAGLKQIECYLPENTVIKAICKAEDKKYLWLGTSKGLIYFNLTTGKDELIIDSKNGLNGNEITSDGLYLDGRGVLWVGTFHGASTYDIKSKRIEKIYPICNIDNITLNGEEVAELPKILKSDENNISFELAGLLFKDEQSVEYEYYLRGLDTEYSVYNGKNNIAVYQNLPPGKYVFLYRAKGKDGIWSYFNKIEFQIEKPFYLQWWAIAIAILFVMAIFYILFKWRIKILKYRNEILEQSIADRTIEVREKNSELKKQKTAIEEQREIAIKQRDEITEKKKEIEDSIHYAEKIQKAILPPREFINKKLENNFILFKPRDIVSGDFYWAAENETKIFITAADCTGHGVPGAFMSMLGVSFLNDIVHTSTNDINAGDILNRLRDSIIEVLHQTGKVHEAKDGMDIALCVIDKNEPKIDFAGAFNPLYIVRDNEIIVKEADRMPIGIFQYSSTLTPFTNHSIEVQKGDRLYMFSDGYPDQFGGARGKKFMISRFKELILRIQSIPMKKQGNYMDETIERWMGEENDQIDDILVIGVEI